MRIDPAGVLLGGFGLAAGLALPLVTVAPNRLVSGQGVSLWAVGQRLGPQLEQVTGQDAWVADVSSTALALALALVVTSLLMLSLIAFWRKAAMGPDGMTVALGVALIPALLLLAGRYALHISQNESTLSRTALGSGFWVMVLVLWLAVSNALQRLRAGWALGAGVRAVIAGCVLAALALGWCDQLSLMREFANHADTLGAAVLRHVQIVVLTLLPALCIGLPLGWMVNRSTRLRQWLLPPLNVIQTIPSIALFGLLMVPLAWAAQAWPGLAAMGVSGIGLAPAVVALTLYSLLPVVRGTQAGLAQVPGAVLDAARGMGMGSAQMFWHAQLPLAAPVILAGIRTATIQTVGLAAVAALVGAGGLGAIMFDGLFGSAQDLVLLGVLPIVGLAVLLDLGFEVLTRLAHVRTGGTV